MSTAGEKRVFDFGPAGAGKAQWAANLPEAGRRTSWRATLTADGSELSIEAEVSPVRDWSVHLIQHSHTDLGYTGLQDEVFEDQVRFIDLACDYAGATVSDEHAERFRWVCESCWAVERFLERASKDRVRRLREHIASGQIEVTALYYQFTDMVSHAELDRSLQWSADVAEKLGAPVTAALNCDVNGWSWGLPQLLAERGIRRMATAINWYRGGAPEPCPGAFWWESPDGARVLVFNGHHYHCGNALGFHETYDIVRERLPRHLGRLLEAASPYRKVNLQLSGTYADNAAPALTHLEILKRWNAEFRLPRLSSSTLGMFFDALEAELPEHDVPVLRGDWTDWWADGNATAPREVSMVRQAHQDLRAAGRIFASRGFPADSAERLDKAWKQAANFDEHTFGAAASISDPYAAQTLAQWAHKSAYAYRASVTSGSLLDEALASAPADAAPAVVVTNTETWDRQDLAVVEIPLKELPNGRYFSLTHQGTPTRYQLVSEREGHLTIGFIADVPASGTQTYAMSAAEEWNREFGETRPSSTHYFWERSEGSVGGDGPRLVFDERSGSVGVVGSGGRAVLCEADGWQPFDLIKEVPARGRAQLDLGRSNRGFARPQFERTTAAWQITHADRGNVWDELVRRSSLPGYPSIEQRFRLLPGLGWLDVELRLDKLPDTAAQAIYLAVPMATGPGTSITLDKALTWYEAGSEQLPGSAKDYHTALSWIQASGDDASVVLAVPDSPMAQFGGIHSGKYLSDLPVQSGLMMVWLYNNYWTTNFPASQHGPLSYRFRLALSPDGSPEWATRFGWSAANALRARFVGSSASDASTACRQPVRLRSTPDSVFLTDTRTLPGGRLLLRFWNVGTSPADFELDAGAPLSAARWSLTPPAGTSDIKLSGHFAGAVLPARSHALLELTL